MNPISSVLSVGLMIAGLATAMTCAVSPAQAQTPAPTQPAPADPKCREESLVHFVTNGQEVPSHVIGKDDPCDDFGGNEVFTPVYKIRVYVNFNISGTIDLDQIDRAYS